MSDSEVILRFEGEVESPVGLTFEDLGRMPGESQVVDVSRFQPGRRGDGVTLESLLALAGPRPGATYVTLHADRDDFHVSVPLAAIGAQGVVVYKLGGEALGASDGGPIRLLLRDPAACHAGELDECANVKYLSRVELTPGRGRDTRPADDAAHEALHAKAEGPAGG